MRVKLNVTLLIHYNKQHNILLEYFDISHSAYQTLGKARHISLTSTGTWLALAVSLIGGD